ncbi:hypothetical protein CPT_Madawaska_170 [Staphylococcus phage Madawaska]|nr:hypothetical protein CPT_Madawaska_170 [Staphylococcus phage Madawaska]
MSNLYMKTNYTSDVRYIKDTVITEYDIKSAGMNILYDSGYLNEEQYNKLRNTQKYERNVIIGKMLKNNKDMNKALMDGFKIARKIFIENNNLKDSDILSIKKDAIFVIGKKCNNLKISKHVRFAESEEYDNYINILGKEHYINLYQNKIDVKGYQNGVKEHHTDYMFKFLIECLWEDKKKDKMDLYKKLLLFKDNMINYNLTSGYYKDIIEDKYIIEMDTLEMYIEDDINEEVRIEDLSYKNQLRFLTDLINVLL